MVNRRWWDLAALATLAVVLFLALIEPPYGPQEWLAWLAAGGFALFYLAYARPRIGTTGQTHLVILAITFGVLLAVGSTGQSSFAIMQAFFYPFLWISAPNTRSAIVANIFVGIAVPLGYVLQYGYDGLLPGVAIGTLSIGFSIALGLWITRIAEYGEERDRLLTELQAAQGELAAMHRDAGVTDERARLAREIHDTIAQSLTGLVMLAQRTGNRLAKVEGEPARAARDDIVLMEEMAREALTEARGLVAALTPVAVDTTLADALGRLAATFERETGVRVTVDATTAALDRELEVVLLRTAQEGLANVRKHARAQHAWITVLRDDATVRLTVRDDGVGPGGASPGAHGFGLAGIRDRVALVGGRAVFGPAEGGGAQLDVEVPARNDRAATAETGTTPVDRPDRIDPEGGRA
ncbi:sensor histidine kinase [Agromyces silvae]|uniref:sensor histidine kinase n=1 Tax=Agromyces silvae TaxID=3388266 RepID=UPI00280AC144|nr:sensor histidine kinase [Agromyces protaetiae]